MPRPFELYSVDDLDNAITRAELETDRRALEAIRLELEFRQREPGCKELVARAIAVRNNLGRGTAKQALLLRKSDARAESPTPEQAHAIEQFKSGENLRISAYAGTGKTSTLRMLANRASPHSSGMYLAFNKDIVESSRKKFPDTVECFTTHQLAYKTVQHRLSASQEKMCDSFNSKTLEEKLNLKPVCLNERQGLSPTTQAFLVKQTLKRFMQSGDAEVLPSHFPRLVALKKLPGGTLVAAKEYVVSLAKAAWLRMTCRDDSLPLGHDGYLKFWCLSKPKLEADFVLLDEAQDTNGVVLDMLKLQPSQVVLVGDRYQQIYEWRGAVNAMEKVDTPKEAFLTTSFRFGAEIADYATQILSRLGADKPLVGNSDIQSRIGRTDPEVMLVRTNATAISELVSALNAGRQPHIVGGVAETQMFLDGVESLMSGRESTVPDLLGFSRWREVVQLVDDGEAPELLSIVRLVNSSDLRQIRKALDGTVSERESDLLISTAHKAKGKEWNRVRLTGDFLRCERDGDGSVKSIPEEELRLFYVAVTRAKHELELDEELSRRLEQR